VRDTLETAVEVVEQAVHNSRRIWKWMSWEVVAILHLLPFLLVFEPSQYLLGKPHKRTSLGGKRPRKKTTE